MKKILIVILASALTLSSINIFKNNNLKEPVLLSYKRIYPIMDLSSTLQERVSVMRFGPTDAARIYGYSLFGTDLALKASNGNQQVASSAGAYIASKLVDTPVMGNEMIAFKERHGVVKNSTEEQEGIEIGKKIMAIALNDGYNDKVAVTKYDLGIEKFTGDMEWKPTGTGDGPLDPNFARLKTLGKDIDNCKTNVPTSEEILKEGKLMFENFKESDAVGLDVLWWLAGTGTSTPSGYWLRMTNTMVKQMNMTEDRASDLIAKVALADFNAAIVIWRYKYGVNLLRPETLWKNLYGASLDKLPRDTPNHPSFPSGHSGFSSAAAGVIVNTIGNYPMSDQLPPDLYAKAWVRNWENPRQAVSEASLSRIHAGFHYPADTKAGEELGYCIGEKISRNYNQLVEEIMKK